MTKSENLCFLLNNAPGQCHAPFLNFSGKHVDICNKLHQVYQVVSSIAVIKVSIYTMALPKLKIKRL